jgi:hypothetical protein
VAEKLLRSLADQFAIVEDGFDPQAELTKVTSPEILSTDHVRATEPALLPWSKPVKMVKAVQDLFKGYGWTGGFRSRTIYCLDLRRPT